MNTDKLINILKVQTSSQQQFRMFAHIVREIKSIPGCTYHSHQGNLYVTKGSALNYSCIVAHMDTVHEIAEDLCALRVGQNITGFNRVTMRQAGIGGDDKVGVFIALECLRFFDDLKVVFFRDEEIGCEGSYEADTFFFKNCNMVLQCDRQGNKDFIMEAAGVTLSSRKFQKDVLPLISTYGYHFTTGMMTDVMALKESKINCSMANISCGYYRPHTEHEYVNVDDIENCLNLVKALIHNLGHKKYEHVYKNHFNEHGYHRFWPQEEVGYCQDCLEPALPDSMYCELCLRHYEALW